MTIVHLDWQYTKEGKLLTTCQALVQEALDGCQHREGDQNIPIGGNTWEIKGELAEKPHWRALHPVGKDARTEASGCEAPEADVFKFLRGGVATELQVPSQSQIKKLAVDKLQDKHVV